MKKTIIWVILLISFLTNGQTFQGKVYYDVSYSEVNVEGVTQEQFNSAMGNKEVFYINGGNHKTINNGFIFNYIMYLSTEKKVFFSPKDENKVFYKDSKTFDKVLMEVKHYDEEYEILGYKCKKVTLFFTDGSKITSFYAPTLKVIPDLFIHDKFDGFYLLLQHTKSISLRLEIEISEYVKKIEATNVLLNEIPKNIFIISEGTEILEAPF